MEYPRNPFSVFHNYSSLLCGALRNSLPLPNLVTKNHTQYASCYGHHTACYPLLNPRSAELFPLFFTLLSDVLQRSKRHAVLSLHQIGLLEENPDIMLLGAEENYL